MVSVCQGKTYVEQRAQSSTDPSGEFSRFHGIRSEQGLNLPAAPRSSHRQLSRIPAPNHLLTSAWDRPGCPRTSGITHVLSCSDVLHAACFRAPSLGFCTSVHVPFYCRVIFILFPFFPSSVAGCLGCLHTWVRINHTAVSICGNFMPGHQCVPLSWVTELSGNSSCKSYYSCVNPLRAAGMKVDAWPTELEQPVVR